MSVLSKTENYEFNFSLTPENTPQTPYYDIGNQPLANIHINDLSLATDSGKSFPKSAKISKQKVIVITGASSGIGLALGEKFGKDKKWIVYSLSRKSQQHDYIKYLTCDITNLNEVKQAFQLIYQQHYRVDAIVNNSGYGLAGNLEALDNHTITNQFDVNLFGMINVNQVGLKYLQSKNGHIVNLGSILSQYSMPYMSAYAASKGAVLAYSKTLLSDLKYHGSKVRVNVFLPGPVKTSFQVNKNVYYSNNLIQANQAKAVLTKIENNAKKTGLNTKKVAHQIYRAIKVHSKKLIHVPGWKMKLVSWLTFFLKQPAKRQKLINHWYQLR